MYILILINNILRYKDDVQLHEDERHTFYADEDGFFAMTIDPVQVGSHND